LFNTQALPELDHDPFAEDVLRWPDGYHAALRETDVVWLPQYGVLATGRYDVVRHILTDWKTFCSSAGIGLTNFHKEKPWRPPSLVLEHDPPEHTRARAIIMRALSPVVLRRLRTLFEAEAERAVSRIIAMAAFDAVTELAEGYPLKVFGDAVGIIAQDRQTMLRYGNIAFNALGPRNRLFLRSQEEAEPVTRWVMQQCRREALDPRGLGAIMYAAADAGEVSEEEAAMLVRSFLSAGVDTTVRALGAALSCFAEEPEQWRILKSEPQRARAATEEAIRFASPFQTVFRTTATDTMLNGIEVAKGQKILLSLAAANRDPRRWENPDRFDITRNAAGHLGFGTGIHGCVGQMLARLEIEVLLGEMARRIETIERIGDIDFDLNNTTRGLSRLPLRVST